MCIPSFLFEKIKSKSNSIPLRQNTRYTGAKKDGHPYYINTIVMRSLRMEIKCFKSPARLLDRD